MSIRPTNLNVKYESRSELKAFQGAVVESENIEYPAGLDAARFERLLAGKIGAKDRLNDLLASRRGLQVEEASVANLGGFAKPSNTPANEESKQGKSWASNVLQQVATGFAKGGR